MVAFRALLIASLAAQAAQAAPCPPPGNDAGTTAATAAEHVAGAAQQLRGDATAAAALQAVQVGTLHGDAEQALATLGFETALDLRLLAGGPEAVELMSALRTSGELSLAVRAKIRLLVGDVDHLARVSMMAGSTDQSRDDQEGKQAASPGHRR